MKNYVDLRPPWISYYLGIAEAVAQRSDCRRSKVGAVIVVKHSWGHQASFGYVGTDPGQPGCLAGQCPRGLLSYDEFPSNPSDYENCISYHAEMNAWKQASFDVQGGSIYVTRKPCDECLHFLIDVGIVEFHWSTYRDTPGGSYFAPRAESLWS